MTGREFLQQLQDEAQHGFHRELKAWVDDDSSVAHALHEYDRRNEA